MLTSLWSERARSAARRRNPHAGFTLIEVTVAMLILMIGMISLSAAIGFALKMSNRGNKVTNTKLLVVSILEQMETLRNTKQLTFKQIRNTGQPDDPDASRPFPGFPSTFSAVSTSPGPDGIFGTADDLVDAGADGLYGTQDDFTNQGLTRMGFSRKIVITSLSDSMKKVEVTLKYASSTGKLEETIGISYLNDDARSNFVP